MMNDYRLGDFSDRFLKQHGLTGFTLTFKPLFDRSSTRRAKRESTVIHGEDPAGVKPLQSSRTVADLIELFHRLAPETAAWVEGPRRYSVRLFDDVGESVHHSITIGELRQRPLERHRQAISRFTKAMHDAFDQADSLLLDPKEIVQITKQIINDRYGN